MAKPVCCAAALLLIAILSPHLAAGQTAFEVRPCVLLPPARAGFRDYIDVKASSALARPAAPRTCDIHRQQGVLLSSRPQHFLEL